MKCHLLIQIGTEPVTAQKHTEFSDDLCQGIHFSSVVFTPVR